MSVNERLKILIEGLGCNPNSFAEKVGVASTVIYNIIGGRLGRPSEELLEKMSISFDSINFNWLITGKGDMFIKMISQNDQVNDQVIYYSGQKSAESSEMVTQNGNLNGNLNANSGEKEVEKWEKQEWHYPVATAKSRNRVFFVKDEVQAGILVGFTQENVDYSHPICIPWLERGIFYLFGVRGDSMYPTLSNGDKVIARQVENIQSIQNGEIHVLITDHGLLIKRLNKRKLNENLITLISDNEELYPEEDYPTRKIMGVFVVVEASTSNLGRNNKDKELIKIYQQLLKANGMTF